MLRIYHSEQDAFSYLSPYTHLDVTPSQLEIYQTLFHCKVVLPCDPNFASKLISELSSGIRTEELCALFSTIFHSVDEVETLLENWIRMGVLE